nr:ATP synthase F0 subunit 8 [Peltonotellus sp.]
MPQMSPIMWTLILMFTSMILTKNMTMLYFNKQKKILNKNFEKKKKKLIKW